MLGAIIGDIVGSRFEWNNNRSKEFDFLTYPHQFRYPHHSDRYGSQEDMDSF